MKAPTAALLGLLVSCPNMPPEARHDKTHQAFDMNECQGHREKVLQ